MPSFTHCCIWKIVNDGLCDNVITTNYDMFFDSIWTKYPNLRVLMNPVLRRGEFNWEGYFSSASKTPATNYWKLHGSLSHIAFKFGGTGTKSHIFKLPRFMVSSNEPETKSYFSLKHSLPFLGYEAERHPKTHFYLTESQDDHFIPFIDWSFSNDRTPFEREIKWAQSKIKQVDSIAAILIIGFSGYFDPKRSPRNEEIVEGLNALLNSGFDKMFMVVSKKQYGRTKDPPYGLMRRLRRSGHCWKFEDSSDDFIEDFFLTYSDYFPFLSVRREFLKTWPRWFLVQPESIHR